MIVIMIRVYIEKTGTVGQNTEKYIYFLSDKVISRYDYIYFVIDYNYFALGSYDCD